MSTHNIHVYVFMEKWRKLSQNYHQILLLNKSSEPIYAESNPFMLNGLFCYNSLDQFNSLLGGIFFPYFLEITFPNTNS